MEHRLAIPLSSSWYTYFRYGKYRMGDVSGSCIYESAITKAAGGRASWRLRRVGQRKTSLFPEHFTPFPPAGACCRPLKGRIRVRRSSSSLSIPLSSSPLPPSRLSLSRAPFPYPSLEALSNSQQPSPSRILCLKIFLLRRFS